VSDLERTKKTAEEILKFLENKENLEKLDSIENIKYLERWNSTNSYRDTPSNCVQWKGFYDYTDVDGTQSKLDYEFILFNDCSYQIRFYQQKINLVHISEFLQHVTTNILLKIKEILYGIGVSIEIKKLELGENIYFIFSKLEINVVLQSEIEIGKLQSVLNKSSFVFDKASDIMSNEFVNLEFKKVNNFYSTLILNY
jgi:hypothetical protein